MIMKNIKTTYFTLFICLLFINTSCSSDDDGGEPTTNHHTYEFQLISDQQTIELSGSVPINPNSTDVLAMHVDSEYHEDDHDYIVMQLFDGDVIIQAGLFLNNNQQPLPLSFEGHGEGTHSFMSITVANITGIPLVSTSGSATLSNLQLFSDSTVPESHASFTMVFEGEFVDVSSNITYQGTGEVVIQPFSY